MAEETLAIQVEEPVASAETEVDVERRRLGALTHKAVLVSVGAAATAKQETEKLLKVLIERGELVEAESRTKMKEVVAKRKAGGQRMKDAAKKAEAEVDKRVEEVLNRLNIPTKAEIEDLTAKIAALTAKIEELKKEQ
jgi:poly(hydroxyalkanoate) granule-associated protein